MSEFVTNMFQYDVTVGIIRNEKNYVVFCYLDVFGRFGYFFSILLVLAKDLQLQLREARKNRTNVRSTVPAVHGGPTEHVHKNETKQEHRER